MSPIDLIRGKKEEKTGVIPSETFPYSNSTSPRPDIGYPKLQNQAGELCPFSRRRSVALSLCRTDFVSFGTACSEISLATSQ